MDYNSKRNDLLRELVPYYTPATFSIIHKILIGEDALTSSIINFTVVTFASKYESRIEHICEDGTIEYIYISRSYNGQLTDHRRQCFDPFCRKPKIPFEYRPGKTIVTSVSQLNFYRWVINIGLLEFIRENYELINAEFKNNTDSDIVLSSSSLKYSNKIRVSETISDKIFDDDD
jgi:hypothetical protein